MPTIKPLPATAVVLISLAMVGTEEAHSLETYSCPGLDGSPEKRMVHETILENAILAGLAYDEQGKVNYNLQDVCPKRVPSSDDGDILIQISPVPKSIINKASEDFSESHDEAVKVMYEEDDDRYLSCQRDYSMAERIAATYEFAEVNGQLSFLVKIAIIGVDGLADTEELAVMRLKDDNGDEILGIQGTEIDSPSQWNTSISELIGSSCIFDFSVEVAKGFFNYDNLSPLYEEMAGLKLIDIDRFGIVGHSLGGAVVQHLMVKEDFDEALTTLEKALDQDEFDFRAYSFNSIGVKGEVPCGSSMRNLTSVRVAGEILEQIEADLEGVYSRRQIGDIFRYSTDSEWWRIIPDSIELHSIDSVQRAICECLDGTSQEFELGFQR